MILRLIDACTSLRAVVVAQNVCSFQLGFAQMTCILRELADKENREPSLATGFSRHRCLEPSCERERVCCVVDQGKQR